MKSRTLFLLFFCVTLVFVLSSCSSGASSPTPAPTTTLDGATLVQERCSVCHPPAMIERTPHTAAEWKTIVDMMMARGAQLTPQDEDVVVSYLSSNFGK